MAEEIKLGNNDTLKPFRVVVERKNSSKGKKFYAGFDTREEAMDVARDRNSSSEEFVYTVEER